MKTKKNKDSRWVQWAFRILLAVGLVFLVWATAFYLVLHSGFMLAKDSTNQSGVTEPQPSTFGDIATLLFGASSIALTLVALVIAAAALLGWQVVEKALVKISTETAEKAKNSLEVELRGRILSSVGYFVGETSRVPGSLYLDDNNDPDRSKRNRMKEAVQICQQGYDFLKGAQGPGKYMTLNNLIFYGCILNDPRRQDFLLRGARELLEVAQEHSSTELEITACRAILQYSSTLNERDAANRILLSIKDRTDCTEAQRAEAELYFEHFKREDLERLRRGLSS